MAPAAASTTFTVDNTAPTISIGSPSEAYVAGGPVTYSVTYADANFGSSSLSLADITLINNGIGTANGVISGVSGSGHPDTVTVSSITGDGPLGISIAAGTASDLAGNAALAAGSSTTFTADNTGPTVDTPASATPNPVTNPTTDLCVLGRGYCHGRGEPDVQLGGYDAAQRGRNANLWRQQRQQRSKEDYGLLSMAGTYGLT